MLSAFLVAHMSMLRSRWSRGKKLATPRTPERPADDHLVTHVPNRTSLAVRSSLLLLTLAAGCYRPADDEPAGGDADVVDPEVDAPAPDVDAAAPELDAGVDADIDAAVPPAARTWPRTAADLRTAMGDRGRWTAAWQLDELAGAAVDDLARLPLVPSGSVAYRQPGAWDDDLAVGFDSADDGLVADDVPFELVHDRSMAALMAVRIDPTTAAGAIAARRGRDGTGVTLLAVDRDTGYLRAELSDGTHVAAATIPIDHRDARYHGVLVVIDRETHVLRLMSDLGRSPAVSIAQVGDAVTAAPFTLGAGGAGPAARASVAYVAIATDDVVGLAPDGDRALYALRRETRRPAPTVRPPAELPWVPAWPIRRDQRARYTIDVAPSDLRLITNAHLWISPIGDDSNAGAASTPKRSLHAALTAMTTATTIHVAPGTYDADAGWYGVNPAFDVNIIAEGGRARLTTADVDLVWHQSAAGAGVFETTAAAPPYTVIDAGLLGEEPWLQAKASPAEVAATPGSWYAAGRTVTVHTRDGRAPDDQVAVMPAATLNAAIDDATRTVYLEGLDFEGGYKALHVNHARKLIIVDTTFRYAAGEGLSVLHTDEVLAFGAVAESNAWDGLAYSWVAHILEVDCAGRDNGRGGSNIDNGSTVHTGGTVVRLGGDYRSNGGPNVADVQGASSWNLGTVAAGSRATSGGQRVNFYIDGQMWIREGSARDRPVDLTIDVVPAGSSRLHLHDTDRATVGGTGTIDDRAE